LADGTFGGLTVEGSSHRQTVGPPTNILSSSSLNIINTTGGDLAFDVAVGATDFVGPIDTAVTTGSGTWINAVGSSISLQWFNDPANAQGADTPDDTPGVQVGDTFTDAPDVAADSFNFVGGPVDVSDPAAFSMTLRFFGTLVDGGTLNSRGQAEIKEVVVSAPATLLLLGSALGLLGWRRLRG
jgi:hypothetical protein